MPDRILITLDDLETAVPLNAALEAAGFGTGTFSALDDARGTLRREKPDLVVFTGAVYERPAQQLAAFARDHEISTLALLEPTDRDDPDKAGRLRVTEVLTKPVRTEELVAVARRLIERRRLQERTGIVGESAAIQEVLVRIEQMAPVSSTVLIQGESGTGKELVAKALHDLSPRRGRAFIAINCAALPETLLESELFGHEKGAFTGAAERRLGRFELADGGTLFLDEIGEISANIQVKLLRVLETRSFFRVGGAQAIKVDVRVRGRHQPQPAGFRADGRVPRGPVLPAERPQHLPAAAAGAARGHPAAGAPLHPRVRQAARPALPGHHPGGDGRAGQRAVARKRPAAPEPDRVDGGAGPGRRDPGQRHPEGRAGGGRERSCRPACRPCRPGEFGVGGAELEFLLRSLMELRLQVEELTAPDGQERAPCRVIGPGRPGGDSGRSRSPPSTSRSRRTSLYRPGHDDGGGREGGYRRCPQGVPWQSPTGGRAARHR